MGADPRGQLGDRPAVLVVAGVCVGGWGGGGGSSKKPQAVEIINFAAGLVAVLHCIICLHGFVAVGSLLYVVFFIFFIRWGRASRIAAGALRKREN